ncbi:MAG: ROK family protein [Bacteroidia bacterium]
MKNALWGIDLGGTKIEAVVLEGLNPEAVISRQRIDTEASKGYDHILGQISRLIEQVSSSTGISPERIGMGTPGALDPPSGGLFKNSNTTALNGKPLKADIEKLTGLSFEIANDANCFALAEATMGAVPEIAPKAEVVFGIILGTGVGGGIVINNKVLNGRQGIAGEWGHSFLDASGGDCYCGNNGCVERILSGTGLQRFYESKTGVFRKLQEISTRIESDPAAQATMDHLHHFFGKGVANVIDLLDPDVIVVGGGVGNIDSIYTEGRKMVEHFVFNPRLDTPIVKPRLGDSAGVFGAAALVHQG